jgi:hypothetical protein
MSGTAGDSFAQRGLRVASRAAATISAALSAGASTFGHDTLSSIASTSGSSSSREQMSA